MATLVQATVNQQDGLPNVEIGDWILTAGVGQTTEDIFISPRSGTNNSTQFWNTEFLGSNLRSVKFHIVGEFGRIQFNGGGGGGVVSRGGTYTDFPFIITNAGGQARVKGSGFSNNGGLRVRGLFNFIVTGEYNTFLKTGDVNFQGRNGVDSYGFNLNQLEIENDFSGGFESPYKDAEISYIEVTTTESDGFAGINIKSDGDPDPANYGGVIRLHDCFIHNTYSGEGLYLGNTSTDLNQHSQQYYVYNNIVCFNAAEVAQIGKAAAGSRVFNNVFICGGNEWLDAFQAFQDNNSQFTFINGEILYENNIIMGARDICLSVQLHDSADSNLSIIEKALVIRNNYFSQTPLGLFFAERRNVNDDEFNIEITGNDFSELDLDYRLRLAADENVYDRIISANSFAERVDFINNKQDDTTTLSTGFLSSDSIGNQTNQTIAKPTFVNSGFNDATINYLDFELYSYQKGLGSESGQYITYNVGQIIFKHQTQKFYSVDVQVVQTVSFKIEPGVDTNWQNYYTELSDPAMIYTLSSSCMHNKLGRGVLYNEEPDTNTVIKWEITYDNGGTPDTPSIKTLCYNRNNQWISERINALNLTGKFIRKGIKVRTVDSREDSDFKYTNWVKIV